MNARFRAWDVRRQAPGGLDPEAWASRRSLLYVISEAGKPIGRKVALNGDDLARMAARLTREAWAKTKERNFNRPLVYAPLGIV
jgi:hypothetical protein